MQKNQNFIDKIFCKPEISDENLAKLDVIFQVETPLFGDVTRKSWMKTHESYISGKRI